jgi:hypothetical protein
MGKDIMEQVGELVGGQVSPVPPTRVIYKYALNPNMEDGFSKIELPAGATFCELAAQQGGPVVYFLVDKAAEVVTRIFRWAKTGEELPAGWVWVSSVSFMGLSLSGGTPHPKLYVCHLMEVPTGVEEEVQTQG